MSPRPGRITRFGRIVRHVVYAPSHIINRLFTAIRAHLAPDSFAIERPGGDTVFVEADNFVVDGEGRLVFYRHWRVRVAAFPAGEWKRAMRDLALEDMEAG